MRPPDRRLLPVSCRLRPHPAAGTAGLRLRHPRRSLVVVEPIPNRAARPSPPCCANSTACTGLSRLAGIRTDRPEFGHCRGSTATSQPELAAFVREARQLSAKQGDYLFDPGIGQLIKLWGFQADEFKAELPPAADIKPPGWPRKPSIADI
jgi:hypothetical protein